jgi:hypothetical protein
LFAWVKKSLQVCWFESAGTINSAVTDHLPASTLMVIYVEQRTDASML